MQWTPDNDAKLFMHVLALHNVQLDFQALALAIGNECTAKAVSHRVAKLRSMAVTQNTAASGGDPGLPVTEPKKRAPRTSTRTSTTTTGLSPQLSSAIVSSAGGTKRTLGKAKAKESLLRKEVRFADEESEDEDAEIKKPTKKKAKTSNLGPSRTYRFDDEMVGYEVI